MKNDGVECHRPARVSTASRKYLFFQILWKSSCHILGYYILLHLIRKKIKFYTAEILIRRIVELWIFSAVISLVKKIIHQTIFLDRILV